MMPILVAAVILLVLGVAMKAGGFSISGAPRGLGLTTH